MPAALALSAPAEGIAGLPLTHRVKLRLVGSSVDAGQLSANHLIILEILIKHQQKRSEIEHISGGSVKENKNSGLVQQNTLPEAYNSDGT